MPQIDIALTEPQLTFVASKSAHPGIVGGLGCVHPDTKIWTERGLMRICEITSPVRVLSWNQKSQKFQLSLSGGAFPKGKANLYRVVTQRGEFVATSHHRSFSSDCNYLPVGEMIAGKELRVASQYLLDSIAEFGLKWLPVDVQHLNQKYADLMQSYADEARQYGQQFLMEASSDQYSAQQLICARKLCRKSCHCASLHAGAQAELSQEHTHHGQPCDRSCTTDFAHHMAELGAGAARYTSSLPSEHILHYRQEPQQFDEMSLPHRTEPAQLFRAQVQNLFSAYKPPVNDNIILEVLEAERNHVYYDMQVLDTNNYVDEFGFIHHNSGKTRAGTMRAVALLLSDPGANVGIFLPTYDLLKLRAMPGVEEDLQMLGMPYSINKSEFKIDVDGYGFIIFRSYDNPARIVSFEIAHAIVDEIDTLKKSEAELAWRKISERVRQKRERPNSVAVVTTPDQGINGFVYDKWVKKKQDGYELIKAPTTSNPFLPAGYIEQIRNNYDPILADLYINGEFVSLSDKKVYHFFNRKTHRSDRVIQPGDRLHISIDFNIGGCCATVWVIDGQTPIAVDEFVSHDTQDFVNRLTKYKGHNLTVYPDASGGANRTNAASSDIDLIQRAGYAVDAPAMNPAVRDRINAFNALLAHNRIAVNTVKCPELTNALEVQGYTEKGEPEKFAVHPAIDDWNDSAGYFIHRRFPICGHIVGGLRVGRG